MIKVNDSPVLVVAIDLGGTHLRAGLVDETGRIRFRLKQRTPQQTAPREIVNALAGAIRECEARGLRPGETITMAAVAVPGSVNTASGATVEVPNLPAVDDFNLAAALQDELERPVILENDANAAAAGEFWLGAARGKRTIACVTLGTGVGGGIILDGKLWRGVHDSAGEIGHVCVEPSSQVICNCGSRGCLELYASATAIVRLTRERIANDGVMDLSLINELTSEDVYQAAMKGNKLAIEVFETMGDYLAIGLVNIMNVVNPELIVVTGGLTNAWELFAPAMHRRIGERKLPLRALQVEIVRGECGDDAGLLGAARLAFDHIELNQLRNGGQYDLDQNRIAG
jgi:glucokinase